jgi:hypothetical protein
MNKTALKNSLIELGATNPSLRPAILAALAPKVASAEDLLAQGVKSLRSYRYDNYRTKLTFQKVIPDPRNGTASIIGKAVLSNQDFLFEISLDIKVEAVDNDQKGLVIVNAQDLTGEGSKGYGAKGYERGNSGKALSEALDKAVTSVMNLELSLI